METELAETELANQICVAADTPAYQQAAQVLAGQLGLGLNGPLAQSPLILQIGAEGLCLSARDKREGGALRVDFLGGSLEHRRRFGGGKSQDIARAIGITASLKPSVLDCTAGLGRDGFILAALGCRVLMLERHPVVFQLLQDGLQRARAAASEELEPILARLCLRCADACQLIRNRDAELLQFAPDVIYIDPMFPERKKSALVKKEMRYFHYFIGDDEDADCLLEQALTLAAHRVVVKRPIKAEPLGERAPNYAIKGKSTRYDVYALRKF